MLLSLIHASFYMFCSIYLNIVVDICVLKKELNVPDACEDV